MTMGDGHVFIFAMILIGAFFIATVVYFGKQWKDEHDDKQLQKQIADDAARIQATVPPLQPGALFSAAINPLPNNTIQFAVRLSSEARTIIAQQNLNSVHILDFPNEHYEEEKRNQARLKESSRLRDHIEASYEPPKNIDITVEYFCQPCGITRSFPSAGEAKAWAEQLRAGLNKLQSILEANETAAEPATFMVMRKS
jgi:hypothetical protein